MSSTDERHRPAKKWGQNFLRNPSAVRRIVDALKPEPDELILEIGPGEGVLTSALIDLGHPLRVVEIDPALAERLRNKGWPLEVIEGDATTVALPEQPWVAVGNLPYNVGNRIIRRVVTHDGFRRALFMVQKEVADRLTASPGDEAYGFFTIAVRIHARTRTLFTLEPGSFFPPPKVRSAVVEFERDRKAMAVTGELLLAVASAAFRMRRKKLRNNLTAVGLSKSDVDRLLLETGIGEDTRAEQMSIADFERLAAAIERDGAAPSFLRSAELQSG